MEVSLRRRTVSASELSALDEGGKAIGWWFASKAPKLAKQAGGLSTTGYEYVYYDPKVAELVRSPNLLTGGKGALDLPFGSVCSDPAPTTGWILYTTQCRRPLSAMTWAATATPRKSWPSILDLDRASKIAEQDALYQITQKVDPNAPGVSDVLDYASRGGLPFKVIAKNRKWGIDFWNDLVGPALQAEMDVENWIRGKVPPVLGSDGVHNTFDVKYINLTPLGIPWNWPERHDHA